MATRESGAAKEPGAAVARRQLRLKLRHARNAANLTQTDVANRLDWSPSKILRIENGQSAVAVSDLIALMSIYVELESERSDLLTLARHARRPTIGNKYRDVYSPAFQEWLDYEAYAATIWQYEPQFVPGLLQLDEYAVPMVSELLDCSKEQAERIAEARRERAEPLIGRDGPTLEIVVDESALRRAANGIDARSRTSVMTAQLEHLKTMNTAGRLALGEDVEEDLNPRISIRIVPLASGPYRMMRQAMEIIELRGDDESWMLYFEGATGEQVIRDQYEEIAEYVDRFTKLAKSLPGPQMTSGQIDKIIAQMSSGEYDIH